MFSNILNCWYHLLLIIYTLLQLSNTSISAFIEFLWQYHYFTIYYTNDELLGRLWHCYLQPRFYHEMRWDTWNNAINSRETEGWLVAWMILSGDTERIFFYYSLNYLYKKHVKCIDHIFVLFQSEFKIKWCDFPTIRKL